MNIIKFFKKLAGGKPDDAPLSDYERLTRAVVRTENLDWEGLAIDRHGGAPISPSPRLKKHRELVGELLARVGLHIEQRDTPRGVQAVSGLGTISDILNADASRQAAMQWRRPPADAWLRQGEA